MSDLVPVNIPIIKPTGRITEEGCYELSDHDYLADPVAVPSINRSIAKTLADLSPNHAWAEHPRFGAAFDDSTEKMDIGVAAHAMFLRGDNVVELVDYPDFKTKAAREQRDEIIAAGRVPLKKAAYGAVHRMLEVLNKFRQATGAFTNGKPELTFVWREGRAWCRVKVDWTPDEPTADLWDLKTMSGHATLRNFTRSAYDQGTDMQASMYPRGVEAIRGERPAGMKFATIEQKPPHGMKVFEFSPVALEVADAKVDYAISRWAECTASNEWPSYAIEPEWVTPPIYVVKEWEGLSAGHQWRERLQSDSGRRDHRTEIIDRMSDAGNPAP